MPLQMKRRVKSSLPPDPEKLNKSRAANAQEAVCAYLDANQEVTRDEVLKFLISDLAHWADRNHLSLKEDLARARYHYERETDGKGAQL